jgi:hypothetical protein
MIVVRCENGDLSGGDIQFVAGTKGYQDRDTYVELENCQKGKYYVYVEMDWDQHVLKNMDDAWFSLTCYGPGTTSIREINNLNKIQVLQSIFKAKIKENSEFVAVQNFAQKGAPNIVRYQCGKAPEGYNFVVIQNNEEEATYKENIEYTTFDGLVMV